MPTATGFLFLAIVLDVWSRRVIGWAMAKSLHASIVLAALEMATAGRKPRDLMHHNDKGSQYTSLAFGQRCPEPGARSPAYGPPQAPSATPTMT